MRPWHWLIVVVVAAGLISAGVGAEPQTAPASAPAASAPANECETMIRELKLVDPQASTLRKRFAERDAQLAKWDSTEGAKLAQVEAQLNEAHRTRDGDAILLAWDQKRRLTAERDALAKQLNDAIMAVLTPEQQIAWLSYLEYVSVLPKYAKANLTPEQLVQVRALCTEAAKEIAPLTAKGDAAGVEALRSKLQSQIDRLLTQQQQLAVYPPSDKPYVPPPPPPKIPAPKPATPPTVSGTKSTTNQPASPAGGKGTKRPPKGNG
jgi:hypothetical protein